MQERRAVEVQARVKAMAKGGQVPGVLAPLSAWFQMLDLQMKLRV